MVARKRISKALRLESGTISRPAEGDRQPVANSPGDMGDDPFACFEEWNGEADGQAYSEKAPSSRTSRAAAQIRDPS